jgi:hypothetical protein
MWNWKKSYTIFNKLNNSFIKNKISFKSYNKYWIKYYTKKELNPENYIYIKNNDQRKVPKECVYDFITKKNNPKQIIINWKIISGKEYCKEQQQWIFSF